MNIEICSGQGFLELAVIAWQPYLLVSDQHGHNNCRPAAGATAICFLQ